MSQARCLVPWVLAALLLGGCAHGGALHLGGVQMFMSPGAVIDGQHVSISAR